jgi:hypothetical protein
MIASAISERMGRKLDYAPEENRIPKEALRAATGKERIAFTPAQRRRLALAGKELTPKERRQCCQIVKPGQLYSSRRPIRPQEQHKQQRDNRAHASCDDHSLPQNPKAIDALSRRYGCRSRRDWRVGGFQ